MRHLLPIVVLLAACKPPPPPIPGEMARSGEVLSVVNGKNVTQGMVDTMLSQIPQATRDRIVASGQMSQLQEQLVLGELVYQKAVELKMHERPEVQQAIALAERNAMAQALIEDVLKQRTTDEAVKAWYDEHAVQFKRPQVKARHILVETEAEANQVLADVKAGGDFAKIATERSKDKGSGKAGGDLGWFEKNRMVPEFAEASFAAEKGALLGPIKTQFGFHVIEVQDKREALPIEEVSDKIKQQLRGEITEKYIEELKTTATITKPGEAGGATVAPADGAAPAGGAAPAAPATPAGGAAPAAPPQ
jgi:peptidyl-prolyl cis-trans isomerase C